MTFETIATGVIDISAVVKKYKVTFINGEEYIGYIAPYYVDYKFDDPTVPIITYALFLIDNLGWSEFCSSGMGSCSTYKSKMMLLYPEYITKIEEVSS